MYRLTYYIHFNSDKVFRYVAMFTRKSTSEFEDTLLDKSYF